MNYWCSSIDFSFFSSCVCAEKRFQKIKHADASFCALYLRTDSCLWSLWIICLVSSGGKKIKICVLKLYKTAWLAIQSVFSSGSNHTLAPVALLYLILRAAGNARPLQVWWARLSQCNTIRAAAGARVCKYILLLLTLTLTAIIRLGYPIILR